VVVTPVLNEKLLGNSSRTTDAVWDTPVVLLCLLKTLILFDSSSTFNTLTCSVPRPTLNTSFSLTDFKLPRTGKNDIKSSSVEMGALTSCVNSSLSELIPTLYDPFRFASVVDNPPTLTNVLFFNSKLVDAMPTNNPFPAG